MARTAIELPDATSVERGETLGLQVYNKLRLALIAGAFEPGQPMTTRSVAAAMQVSLTPAREALGRLVAEGALELTPTRGVQVPVLDEVRLVGIYRIRQVLEVMAAEAAVPLLGRTQIAGLKRLLAAHEAALDRHDYRAALANNHRFHFTIYEASAMPTAVRMIESLWLQIGSTMNLLYPDFDVTRKGTSNHQAMIDAIQQRNARTLCVALRRDLAQGERSVIESLRRTGKKPSRRRGRAVALAAE